MNDSQINIISSKTFTITHFTVAPELLGLSHEFLFKNGQVKIELPPADNLPKEITEESIMESHNSILTIKSWRVENGRNIPTKIEVKSVALQVCLNETITLPHEVLTRKPNPVDLSSKQQQTQLNQITDFHTDLASAAFEWWLRILRWKSNDGSIGRPEIHGFQSGRSTYLLDSATMSRFWAGPILVTMFLPNLITLPVWQDTEATLKRGQESPVYIDSMFDGIEQLKVGNLQQSVVYLAVACEAFMRTRVMQNLPKGLTPALQKYIKDARIGEILDHFLKDTLDDEQNKVFSTIKPNLGQLFKARNKILHSGHKKDLASADCQQYIQATKQLITI